MVGDLQSLGELLTTNGLDCSNRRRSNPGRGISVILDVIGVHVGADIFPQFFLAIEADDRLVAAIVATAHRFVGFGIVRTVVVPRARTPP